MFTDISQFILIIIKSKLIRKKKNLPHTYIAQFYKQKSFHETSQETYYKLAQEDFKIK